MKRILQDMGYMSIYSNDDYNTLDDATMNALALVCNYNEGCRWSDYGITPETWDIINDRRIIPYSDIVSPSPSPTEDTQARYIHIYYTDQPQEAVALIQERLTKLGYTDEPFTPSIYDEGLRDAIDTFCAMNDLNYSQYDQNGITPELQYVIFSESAKPFATPEPTLTPTPRPTTVGQYLAAPIPTMGIVMPRYVRILVVALLAIACIILAIHFFVPNGAKDKEKSGAQTITLEIVYEGKKRAEAVNLKKAYQIGRDHSCDLILDKRDNRVSRCHCELFRRGDSLILKDHSANGTMVNRVKKENEECRLFDKDELQVGGHTITIHI